MAVEHLRDVWGYAWREGDPGTGHRFDWCPACQYERGVQDGSVRVSEWR